MCACARARCSVGSLSVCGEKRAQSIVRALTSRAPRTDRDAACVVMDDGSDAESAPPDAAGVAVPAQATNHPVWVASVGTGKRSAPAAATAAATAPAVPTKFGPISLHQLGLRMREEEDGASSIGGEDVHPQKKRPRAAEYDEDADGGDDAENDVDDAEVLAAAAFGGKQKSGALSVISDSDASEVSLGAKKAAQARMFPVSGVACVGCALPAKVAAIDEFVRSNCGNMTSTALYKLAALKYVQTVCEPATREGVATPTWDWKSIKEHYSMHRIDVRATRYDNIRCLSAVKKTLEMSLMREDEDGNQVLDKANSESLLKVIALQSREVSLLGDASTAPTGRQRK